MLELLALVLKPKLAWMVLSSSATGLSLAAGLLTLSAIMIVRGASVLLIQREELPSLSEMERHIEKHDERLDKLYDLINEKFDRLEQDRQSRKMDSDKRYEALQHDVTFIYGGIAVIGVFLAIGVIKLSGTDAKLRMSKEDSVQLGYLLSGLRDARNRSDDRNR